MHLDRTLLSLTFAGLLAGLAPGLVGQELAWKRSLDEALQTAADQQQVLLVAILVPGERDSEALIDTYRDGSVRKLTKNCVCLRIDIDSERGDEDRLSVLERFLGAAPREPYVAPHHVVVHPDGKTVLGSAAHRMTAGQLEWFVADGIRRFDGSFSWPRSDRMRAPESLRYDERETTEQELRIPPTRKEVKAAIEGLKKGGAGWQGAIQHYTTLLASDEKSAVKYVDTQLSGGRGMITGMALTTISRMSPVEYAPILEDFVDYRRANRRREAAKGLWRMAHAKSRKVIMKQLKREKDDQALAWLLRAAVATAPDDKATIAALEKALYKSDNAFVRMHAVVGAGAVEVREHALRLMRKGLNDADPDVRSAAAFAMAARRDQELLGALEPSIRGEPDAEAKRWMELAMNVLSNRLDLAGFDTLRRKVLKEVDTPRDRNRGRGRQGDDQDGGDQNGGGKNGGGKNGGGKDRGGNDRGSRTEGRR
ncbi:MAG: hypothetical protein ACE37K_07030 [Planctomycetota bacterium]